MKGLILLLPILAYTGIVESAKPPKEIKFIGFSTQQALPGNSLLTKNAACQDAFPEFTPAARMSIYDEMIGAMDDGTFTQPGADALLRPSTYVSVVDTGGRSGVVVVDSSGGYLQDSVPDIVHQQYLRGGSYLI